MLPSMRYLEAAEEEVSAFQGSLVDLRSRSDQKPHFVGMHLQPEGSQEGLSSPVCSTCVFLTSEYRA